MENTRGRSVNFSLTEGDHSRVAISVFIISENTIKPQVGKYTGLKGYGMLQLSNLDQFGNITDGSNQGKSCS
jgi:hypothetical protein